MVTTDKVQAGDSTASTSTGTTWRCPYTPPKAEQGWECPRCGRINAPWVRQCDCSRNNWSITWATNKTTVGDNPEWWKDYVTCGQADNVLNNPNVYTTDASPAVGGSDYWDQYTKTWTNVPNSTYYNQDPSTKTIHNGKTNYKE